MLNYRKHWKWLHNVCTLLFTFLQGWNHYIDSFGKGFDIWKEKHQIHNLEQFEESSYGIRRFTTKFMGSSHTEFDFKKIPRKILMTVLWKLIFWQVLVFERPYTGLKINQFILFYTINLLDPRQVCIFCSIFDHKIPSICVQLWWNATKIKTMLYCERVIKSQNCS